MLSLERRFWLRLERFLSFHDRRCSQKVSKVTRASFTIVPPQEEYSNLGLFAFCAVELCLCRFPGAARRAPESLSVSRAAVVPWTFCVS
jgi:hypothetical protein